MHNFSVSLRTSFNPPDINRFRSDTGKAITYTLLNIRYPGKCPKPLQHTYKHTHTHTHTYKHPIHLINQLVRILKQKNFD